MLIVVCFTKILSRYVVLQIALSFKDLPSRAYRGSGSRSAMFFFSFFHILFTYQREREREQRGGERQREREILKQTPRPEHRA